MSWCTAVIKKKMADRKSVAWGKTILANSRTAQGRAATATSIVKELSIVVQTLIKK